jgi:4-amino-4-deoxy-L-arabinose transferase-like glycosyltransferase
VLSLGYWLHAPGLINPALSLILLLIAAAIARHCYSIETGRLAVLIAVLSPFFLVNSVMRMSHMVCSVLIASACLLLFRGLRSEKLAPFAGAFALLGATFFVRPYTAFVLTAVLGLSALWCVRTDRRLLAKVALAGVLFGALTISGMMAYNRRYTGSPFTSPYAQMAGRNAPPELSLRPSRIWGGIRIYGRLAFQETLFSTFPFVFLLAGYTLLREEKSRRETIILSALYPILILAYLLHPDGSGIFYGERFHFEAYFAIAVLGAQGLRLLAQQSGLPRSAWIMVVAALAVMQVAQLSIVSNVLLHRGIAYRRMEERTRRLSPTIGLVFFHTSDSFVAMHFNLNEPDWRKASRVYLVDPGPAARSEWACRVGRPDWIVLDYDGSTESVREQIGHSACSVAGRPDFPSG